MKKLALLGSTFALLVPVAAVSPAAAAVKAPTPVVDIGGGGPGTCIYYGGYALGYGPGYYCLRNGVWVFDRR